MIILSHFQTTGLLAARQAGERTATTSFDLGVTRSNATLDSSGVHFANGEVADWPSVERIAKDENGCFVLDAQGCRKLVGYSEANKRAYSLMPTLRAPALLLSGVTMHRIKGIDPLEDTARKLRTIEPLTGSVLDTATGLGYTAIAAARTAEQVTSIELDPEVLDLARSNPWSQALFEDPKIKQLMGDSSDLIRAFSDQSFHRILHDPPMISLAGDLYSTEFYRELFRVLRPGGRLFHYIGDPDSPGGRTTTQGVMRRLPMVGFKRVIQRPEAFGIVAQK
jgi:predicted methyltransferase